MKDTTLNQPTYKQVRFLHAMISQLSLPLIAKNFRLPLYRLKQQLDEVVEKLNEEQMLIFLMNGGVEKTTENGKFYTYPDIPSRGDATDKVYSDKLKAYISVKHKIDRQLRKLDDTSAEVLISPIFTEDEFDDFCKSIHNIDLINCKDILVKTE